MARKSSVRQLLSTAIAPLAWPASTDLAVIIGGVHTRVDHIQQRVHQPLTGAHLLPGFLPCGAEVPEWQRHMEAAEMNNSLLSHGALPDGLRGRTTDSSHVDPV